jgi:cell wall integrity and stress response component
MDEALDSMARLGNVLMRSQTSTSSSTPSPSPPPEPSQTEVFTSVTTVTGQVRTVLVTPTADATLGQSSTQNGSGVSGGTIAGIVVGVVAGIALIATAIFFCVRRRRKQEPSPEGSFTAERMNGSSNTSNNIPSRQVSQLSSAGLLGKAPRIQTNFFPSDPDPRSATTNSSNNADRRSVGTDQRLNPWALYSQDDRNSSVSLQDNQDYSRQLRVSSEVDRESRSS